MPAKTDYDATVIFEKLCQLQRKRRLANEKAESFKREALDLTKEITGLKDQLKSLYRGKSDTEELVQTINEL